MPVQCENGRSEERQLPRPASVKHARAVAAIYEGAPRIAAVVEEQFGPHGRLISSSKSRHLRRYPSRLVVFNASLLVSRVKVWWGDIDLTEDAPKLRAIGRELGRELHVLSKQDGRFRGRDADPLVATFVYWTDGRHQALGDREWQQYEFRRGRPRRLRENRS